LQEGLEGLLHVRAGEGRVPVGGVLQALLDEGHLPAGRREEGPEEPALVEVGDVAEAAAQPAVEGLREERRLEAALDEADEVVRELRLLLGRAPLRRGELARGELRHVFSFTT